MICDGGWSKRTHKHSYNAMGGVGVIIGAETKKLLHIGVRNKYCYVCQRAENVGCKPHPHDCFKNWSLSSQAMEADIIIEGFLKAGKLGIRYMSIIADGDSSVYARIREEVPVWGCHVKKAECANHACKCLRASLEKLVDENPSYKGRGNLTKATRVRLTSSVRCAIRMRSNQKKKNAAKLLEKDIRNSVHHIFGNHKNCSSDFCKVQQGDSKKHSNYQEVDEDDKDMEDNDILTDQINLWNEGSSIEDQEDSRRDTDTNCFNKKLINDISVILNRVAVKSERLIGNFTTNLAECWMHIRSKFDGGKFFNHCSRGSWHTRCFAGGLRFNEGPKWSPKVWEKTTGTAAGEIYNSLYEKREKCVENNTRSKSTKESKLKRWKRKSKLTRESNSKKAKLEYGKGARDVEPDVSAGELNKKMEQYIEKEINVSEKEINDIEEQTKRQSECKLWKAERKKRITSSNFGCVCKRNPKVKVAPLVRSMLYSSFKGTKMTQLGLNNEALAIKEYIERKRSNKEIVKVEKTGLIICHKDPYLAASPDGKVVYENGECGLIEIKNILYNKPLSLSQGASIKSVKNFCLEVNKSSGSLQLKKSHNYYYQCQGLLYISRLPWIDFVVRTEHPYELHIERILFDEELWITEMSPKLKAFYFKAILPELAFPRHGKSPGIREPGLWVCKIIHIHLEYHISSVIRQILFLPKKSQRSRSVLHDGSRSMGLFRKGKIGITCI